jgi:hypothetical protein
LRAPDAARRCKSHDNPQANLTTPAPIITEPSTLAIASPFGAIFSIAEKGAVVVAGSVNSAERVSAIRAAGADAFTIGTAAIDASYAPGAGPLAAQLKAVLADCRAAG